MPLFGGLNKSQQSQQDLAKLAWEQYKQMLMNTMGVQGAMGGQLGSFPNAYGPAGQLQQSGLGTAKRVILPEEIVVHALTGWRRWSVSMFGATLMSNNGYRWEPYKALQAECASGHQCRGVGCGCGIYAYKERKKAENGENAPTELTHIWGEVWLWGRVIECEHGYRAQFAYPKAFVKTGGIAEQLATAYGVKVIE